MKPNPAVTATGRRSRSEPAGRPAPAARAVSIANLHPKLRLEQRAVRRLIHTLDAAQGAIRVPNPAFLGGELSLVFMHDAALAKLHADFLDDPSTTDVITFEGDSLAGTGGEICVSADTAAAYARRHRRDFSSELSLYLVHGWLHLAGYDDLQPVKKRAMRRAEARAMRVLEVAGALPSFVLRS